MAESHIAIHTWPEHGYFAAALFFCGTGEPKIAMTILQTALPAQQIKVRELERGFTKISVGLTNGYLPRMWEQ